MHVLFLERWARDHCNSLNRVLLDKNTQSHYTLQYRSHRQPASVLKSAG
jgi:hypothetical protein